MSSNVKRNNMKQINLESPMEAQPISERQEGWKKRN